MLHPVLETYFLCLFQDDEPSPKKLKPESNKVHGNYTAN